MIQIKSTLLTTHKQFFRYAVVGLLSNIALYLIYLLLTSQGIGAKSAMSGLYLMGVLQTFVFNKKWTFRHDGHVSKTFWRYLASYGLGYLINLVVLIVLVDQLGIPHQVVQGVMIIALALLLFILQKYWVFVESKPLIFNSKHSEININESPAFPKLNRQDLLALGVIWCVVLFFYWNSFNAKEFWWTDESRHTMDGVFFLDFFQDFPWRNPLDYAYSYFAQYPALALNWYPPFFSIVEAAFFKIFGLSEFSARFTVLAFILLGTTAWYFWTSPNFGRIAAVTSCLIYITNPEVSHWTRSVMLEAPAVAMIIMSVFSFELYLNRPNFKRAIATGVILALTLLLKQTTVFIVPVLLGYAWLSEKRSLLWRREAWSAYGIVSLSVVILAIHTIKFGSTATQAIGKGLETNTDWAPGILSLARWQLHLLALWAVIGWPLALAAILGGISWLISKRSPRDSIILLWIAGWYLMATLLISGEGNAPSYVMYVLPAIALLSIRMSNQVTFGPNIYPNPILILPVAIVVWNIYLTQKTEHPYVSGYKQAADFVVKQNIQGPILFAGKHDGNFIFHVREKDPEKQKVVVRGDKILVSMSVHKFFGVQSYVKNEEDIANILNRYGIGLIVVESRDLVGLKEFKLLQDFLHSDKFRLLKSIPLETNFSEFKDISILVYQYLDQKINPDAIITIPLPQMGREIQFRPSALKTFDTN